MINLHSNKRKVSLRETKRKELLEDLFNTLKTSEDRAKLLVLIQTYKDELAENNL